MAMDISDLPRLADEVPDVLRDVHKYRIFPDLNSLECLLPTTLLSQEPSSESEDGSTCEAFLFFDWDLYFGQRNNPRSSSKSENSSMPPTLTSATTPPPSEEGGASSSSDTEDRSQFRAKLKEAKKGDDKLTFPPLKPKGGLPYQPHIQIHDANHSLSLTLSGTQWQTNNSSLPSPPYSRESSTPRRVAPNSQAPVRGKRNGPLKNADDVAEVRNLGACTRCKFRKVKCDGNIVCGNCIDIAEKYVSNVSLAADQHMCFRKPFTDGEFVFPMIGKAEVGRPSAGSRSKTGAMMIQVYFGTGQAVGQPLDLSVVSHNDSSTIASPTGQLSDASYRLNLDRMPLEDQLCNWAKECHDSSGTTDFQAMLDDLMSACVKEGVQCFPRSQLDLLKRVYNMRFLFKIWSQRHFFYYDGRQYRRLPAALQCGLRQLTKSIMKRLESDICKDIWKTLEAKTVKPIEAAAVRMAGWIVTMQMMLMYRDLHTLTESAPTFRPGVRPPPTWSYVLSVTRNLFNTLVNLCEVCFSKKPPAELDIEGSSSTRQSKQVINAYFKKVQISQECFYENLNPRQGSLDQILFVRLPPVSKPQNTKRQKTKRN
ncbi:hypothetical protein JX265_005298 [Neoarthrinium moseri]|uniref:Zn(2)-C6 fungal-type domain-containing protein n=1 Tax=Neoarthrinium moseri TaxID=1658444 RepID=A0A9Q0ARN7_9PEZI|nr:hypothetical protein JX265_005298 [Neoarthrinium moseri]